MQFNQMSSSQDADFAEDWPWSRMQQSLTSRQTNTRSNSWLVATIALPLVCCFALDARAATPIAFREDAGRLEITAGDQPVATYVFVDPKITRPYFSHVHVPGGIQVTRNHPPKEGIDAVDHATFHPGIWLAFGDIDGQDSWRNKAAVRHDRFVDAPTSSESTGTFTVQNSYRRSDDPEQVVCMETCRYTISVERTGYLLVSDSMFVSPKEFAFGDQEEMGLGIRVATPITVKSGGSMIDASARANEKQVWGKSSPWCDYFGTIDNRQVGIMIMPDPANIRPSRYHARDYGLLVANPFGQKVFGEAEKSRVVVPAGVPFRLRFGVLLHAISGKSLDRPAVYAEYLQKLADVPRPKE